MSIRPYRDIQRRFRHRAANGPGETRETDIGLTGGGNGTHGVYLDGPPDHRLKVTNVADHPVAMTGKKAGEIEAAKAAEADAA